jgi:hypothetical protein
VLRPRPIQMITYEKLSIYARYNGSSDLFLRMGSEQEQKTLTREDWLILYRFEDFYCPIDQTQPSPQRVVEVEQDLLNCCTDATIFLYTKQVVERQCQDRRNPPLLMRIMDWLLG